MHLRGDLETQSVISLRPIFESPPQRDLETLLDFLPVLYPGGAAWLSQRLADVSRGTADLVVAVSDDDRIVGAAIGLFKKTSARYKICTLYVAPEHRAQGIGGSLLGWCLDRAQGHAAAAAYITSASTVQDSISPVLASRGFSYLGRVDGRYGIGRDEDVFEIVLAGTD